MKTKDKATMDQMQLKKAYKRAKRLTNMARFAIPVLLIALVFNVVAQKYSWAMLQLIIILLLAKYLLDVKIAEKKHSETLKKERKKS